jgi:hypothetical protein
MAKQKSAPTPAEQKLSDLRVKLDTADKANTAKPTETTAKALDAAKTAVADQQKIVNRERFIRVAGGRVNKARAAIANLANVAAPRSYTYDESDVAKAESVLGEAVKATIAKMRSALASGNAKTAKAGIENPFA